MTSIYPNQIPIEVQNDPKREGERIVFKKLKEIEGDFEIFYSVDWTSESKKNRPRRDGECDFIVVHKNLGVICFEVKGGKVFKEINEFGIPEFFSKDKKGEIHKIKNPYKQAKRTKNIIIDKWKAYKKDAYINVQHAVIFPETENPGVYKTINDLKEITLFKNDLERDLTLEVYKLFELDAADTYDEIDEKGSEYLKEIFLSIIPLRENLSEVISYQNKEIEKQTQNFLSNYLIAKEGFVNKIVFKGGAGTGKTHLAIEIAKSFSNSGKTLLVCFNRGLKNFLHKNTSEKRSIEVKSIHECITYLDINNFTEEEVIYKILSKNFFYESIIIDEAQDFQEEWWQIIINSTNNKKSNIYVFFDNNQKIYNQNKNIDFLKNSDFKFIELSTNYRNTKNIHNLISAFYDGSDYKNLSIKGEKIRLFKNNLSNEGFLVELLSKLIIENDLMPHQISILTAIPVKDTKVHELIDKSVFKYTNCEYPTDNSIIIDTIQRYKGLENDVVIIFNASEKDNDLNLIYTGFSRAKLILYVLDSDENYLEKISKIIKINNQS